MTKRIGVVGLAIAAAILLGGCAGREAEPKPAKEAAQSAVARPITPLSAKEARSALDFSATIPPERATPAPTGQAQIDENYEPFPLDENAHEFPNATELGAQALRFEWYSLLLNPEPTLGEDGRVNLCLKNPEQSTAYLMLDIRTTADDRLLYRTGLIAPGLGLERVTLSKDALSLLHPGENAITYAIYSFDTRNYQSMGEARLQVALNKEGDG